MRISDWSSDVCSSDLSTATSPPPSPRRPSAGPTATPSPSVHPNRGRRGISEVVAERREEKRMVPPPLRRARSRSISSIPHLLAQDKDFDFDFDVDTDDGPKLALKHRSSATDRKSTRLNSRH